MAESWVSQPVDQLSLRATTVRTHNNDLHNQNFIRYQSRPTECTDTIRFAHPAEQAIADLLTSHNIAWLYEPTTFPLVTGDRGEPIQSFTPDFFLPDQNVYIEMTTMRQSLVTRKNRKFRLMRELYPEIDVKLLYRKDVELIVDRYTGSPNLSGYLDPVPLHSSTQIEHQVQILTDQLLNARHDRLNLINLGESARPFQTQIAKALQTAGVRIGTGQITLSDRTGGKRVNFRARNLLEGAERTIIVADVISTGLSVWTALEALRSHGFDRIDVVTMLDRPSARILNTSITFAAFTAPSIWIVGAGLGETPEQRGLPDLHRSCIPLPE